MIIFSFSLLTDAEWGGENYGSNVPHSLLNLIPITICMCVPTCLFFVSSISYISTCTVHEHVFSCLCEKQTHSEKNWRHEVEVADSYRVKRKNLFVHDKIGKLLNFKAKLLPLVLIIIYKAPTSKFIWFFL